MKYCYICGNAINDNEQYFVVGPNSYVCSNEKCYYIYYWDSLAAKFVVNPYHEYASIDGRLYQIGDDKDEPQGSDGRHYEIEFFDGAKKSTNSLWSIGEIPTDKKHIFKENARFV